MPMNDLPTLTIVDKLFFVFFLIGMLLILALGVFGVYRIFTYVDPCIKICHPGAPVFSNDKMCVCGYNLEVKEIK